MHVREIERSHSRRGDLPFLELVEVGTFCCAVLTEAVKTQRVENQTNIDLSWYIMIFMKGDIITSLTLQ